MHPNLALGTVTATLQAWQRSPRLRSFMILTQAVQEAAVSPSRPPVAGQESGRPSKSQEEKRAYPLLLRHRVLHYLGSIFVVINQIKLPRFFHGWKQTVGRRDNKSFPSSEMFLYREFISLEKQPQTHCPLMWRLATHMKVWSAQWRESLRKPCIKRQELLGYWSVTIFPSSKRNELDPLPLVIPEKNV